MNDYAAQNAVNQERFWSYVDRSGGADQCWPWTGAKDDLGYGRFHVGLRRNSSRLAHRISYGLTHNQEPEAVCHRCDNPPCCNPAHLWAGTRVENNVDMTAKGRHAAHGSTDYFPRGEKHHAAKLCDGDVRQIRRRYAAGGVTQYQLADEYGVSQRTVAKVVHRIGWSHV